MFNVLRAHPFRQVLTFIAHEHWSSGHSSCFLWTKFSIINLLDKNIIFYVLFTVPRHSCLHSPLCQSHSAPIFRQSSSAVTKIYFNKISWHSLETKWWCSLIYKHIKILFPFYTSLSLAICFGKLIKNRLH
jgi:hypothetical protein